MPFIEALRQLSFSVGRPVVNFFRPGLLNFVLLLTPHAQTYVHVCRCNSGGLGRVLTYPKPHLIRVGPPRAIAY